MQRGALALFVLTLGCLPSEAPRVELALVVDGSGLATSATDLGWTIEFEQVRMAIGELEFTTAGEVHQAKQASGGAWSNAGAVLLGLVLPSAHAHPGHYQGGEVIGELPGAFVLDFIAGEGAELGKATLIVGEYTAANFLFRRASADELAPGDPLTGHTAILAGTATQGEQAIAFTLVIDSPLDRQLVGAPFEATIEEQSEVELGFQWLSADPYEGDHFFDGIDFAALDAADGAVDQVVILIDPERDPAMPAALVDAYDNLRRDFQTHDLFDIVTREP